MIGRSAPDRHLASWHAHERDSDLGSSDEPTFVENFPNMIHLSLLAAIVVAVGVITSGQPSPDALSARAGAHCGAFSDDDYYRIYLSPPGRRCQDFSIFGLACDQKLCDCHRAVLIHQQVDALGSPFDAGLSLRLKVRHHSKDGIARRDRQRTFGLPRHRPLQAHQRQPRPRRGRRGAQGIRRAPARQRALKRHAAAAVGRRVRGDPRRGGERGRSRAGRGQDRGRDACAVRHRRRPAGGGGVGQCLHCGQRLAVGRFQKSPNQRGPLDFACEHDKVLKMRKDSRPAVFRPRPGCTLCLLDGSVLDRGLDFLLFNCRHSHHSLLAPDIIEQFMAGKQPRRLTLMWFQRNRLMVDWQAQCRLMASFEEDV